MAIKVHASFAMPAGVWLKRAYIEPEGVKIGVLAEALGISRQALTAVLNGRSAMSPSLAVRMEKALGTNANTLMNMQTVYELAQAREKEKAFPVRRLNVP